MLEVDAVTMRFGGIVANEQVSFRVERGRIDSIIGPNGAGKTTLFNAVTGIYEPTEGHVRFEGHSMRRRYGAGVAIRALLTGLVTAFGVTVAFHVSALWVAAIDGHMVYGQPFPWLESLKTLGSSIVGTRHGWGWLVPLVGFAVGSGAHQVLWFNGRRTPDLVARYGISRTFQNIRLFGDMSLRENV
ncbi:MAG: ATP-binding cassette domain-containing protein, partial [Phycisphaerae bacterium]|nr:ATP-binding cassette domain-containing protein [Phycisphaerae bacterium]